MKNFLQRGSDCKSTGNTFKFYVEVNGELEDSNRSLEMDYVKIEPQLLNKEIIVAAGKKVLFFPYAVDSSSGLLGDLYVTNFRLMFKPYKNAFQNTILHQENLLLGDYSACLTNIESLYQINGEKKRRLILEEKITGRIKTLGVVCKNMKIFTLNFNQSSFDEGNNIAKTLLHYAFPGRHELLFSYDYNQRIPDEELPPGMRLFTNREDWEEELARTCTMSSSSWRISGMNSKFEISTSLPKWIVIPHSVLDCDFVTASQSFRCNRPPIWTWSSPNGAALVRMADLLPTITDRTQENRMLENIRKCHPELKVPSIKYLDKELPSVSELFQSYTKFRELCMPDSFRQFRAQDSHLFSYLENTKWLQFVSSCLKVVVDAAQEIQRGTTIVLQESDGRDMSAVVASLIQLVLDPHARSIIGFQSIVQKEWVAFGHPFCKRIGHIKTNHSGQSPVFLFFLDCVWQLQNQFPLSFEFTETYLTTLWDSVHISVFDTFSFDCEKDRHDSFLTYHTEGLKPRSVWNWNNQFSPSLLELFINPIYELSPFYPLDEGQRNSVILPEPSLPSMELWMQCYFRWQPLLSIKGGGHSQIDATHRQLINKISQLCNCLSKGKKGLRNGVNNDSSLLTQHLHNGEYKLCTPTDFYFNFIIPKNRIDNFYPFVIIPNADITTDDLTEVFESVSTSTLTLAQ